jgi:AraC-like DNA-binding protein/mannose-6-phosphate isomerase-like protein (cupin superfamily)
MLQPLPTWPRLTPDAVSVVLQDLRLSAAHYCQCEMMAPWGIRLQARQEAMVHFVLEGQCWLETPTQKAVHLQTGDVVMLPHGAGHRLLSAPDSESHTLEELSPTKVGETTYRLTAGGTGQRASLICCGINFEEPALHPVLELMPTLLLVRDESRREPALHSFLGAMTEEIRRQRPGATTVVTRLADIVVTHIVRAWIEAQPDRSQGWVAALRDPQIGKSLAAFHRQPNRSWSVQALAEVANLSRSVFSARFVRAVGVSPARYVSRWRMHIATTWLRGNRLSVEEVSVRLGFSSEAVFSRTFKRLLGSSPTAFRAKDVASASSRVSRRRPGPPR